MKYQSNVILYLTLIPSIVFLPSCRTKSPHIGDSVVKTTESIENADVSTKDMWGKKKTSLILPIVNYSSNQQETACVDACLEKGVIWTGDWNTVDNEMIVDKDKPTKKPRMECGCSEINYQTFPNCVVAYKIDKQKMNFQKEVKNDLRRYYSQTYYFDCGKPDSTGWNDQISTIVVPPGKKIKVCRDVKMEGPCRTLDNTTWDLGKEDGMEVSSFQVQ
jgi:hypothetical protein